MNQARRTCLSNYFRIDVMDHLTKNTNLAYCSWKYWHGAMLHAKGMDIVSAYDMYLDVCEVKMDTTWTNADSVSYHTFREQLSSQMLQYDPRKRHCPGDELIRISTMQPLNLWTGRKIKEKISPNAGGLVSMQQYQAAKIGGKRAQVCVDILQFTHHCESVVYAAKNPWGCYVCGENTYTKC